MNINKYKIFVCVYIKRINKYEKNCLEISLAGVSNSSNPGFLQDFPKDSNLRCIAIIVFNGWAA